MNNTYKIKQYKFTDYSRNALHQIIITKCNCKKFHILL
jgi:hypothetical protein